MRHGTEPLRRSSRSYEGNFELILVMGWERELNSMRSNLPLFLSSSVVERSAVNWLVVGSNPTWGDLIHSEFFNSEWKGSLWPLRVGNPFPVSLFLLHSISSYHILFCDIWESPSIPRCRSGIILCSIVRGLFPISQLRILRCTSTSKYIFDAVIDSPKRPQLPWANVLMTKNAFLLFY